MRVIGADELRAALPPQVIFEAVSAALIAHAEGRTVVPTPIHLMFPEAAGDAHVKVGMLAGAETFVVKVATGFYNNADRGLPTNSGAVLAVSAATGEVLALLDDRGWLTAVRTAATAALATDAISFAGPLTLGVVGTGEQARLAAKWLRELRDVPRVLIAGRHPDSAKRLADQVDGAIAVSLEDVLEHADAVVTATASTAALFQPTQARRGTRFTALGADMPGKQELPAGLFDNAQVIVDDLNQAAAHGDLSHALALGTARAQDVITLGEIIRDRPQPSRRTTIVDLTGVGAIDASIANMALDACLT